MRIVTLLTLCAVLWCSQGRKQEECLNQHITPPMIKDMMETSERIQKSLPVSIWIYTWTPITMCTFNKVTCITNVLLLLQKDNAPFHRILGKLKNCSKKLNVADFKRILEIYNEHVFQKLWKNNSQQLPKMFMGSFLRLKYKMEICETEGNQTLSLCGEENLKTFEDTIKMLQPKSLLKAQSEFRQVLVWISIAMDKSRTHEIH
uniref:Interleukin 26 n=1 Tax=Cyprinus carpio TaxID=7962 RepID=A0A8C2F203_CYPCA